VIQEGDPGNFGITVTLASPPGGNITGFVCENHTVPYFLVISISWDLFQPIS
jgi:hypothetical protein